MKSPGMATTGVATTAAAAAAAAAVGTTTTGMEASKSLAEKAMRSTMQSKKNELVLNYLDTLEDPLPMDEEDMALRMETERMAERPSKRAPRSQSNILYIIY